MLLSRKGDQGEIAMDLSTFFQTIIYGILMGGIYGLASIGLSIIFGTINIVNFAHGEFLMVGMYLTYLVWALLGGLDPFLGLVITIPMMFLFGILIYKLTIRLVVRGPDSAKIFVTVGLGVLLQNLSLLIFTADYHSVKTSYTGVAVKLFSLDISVPRLLAFFASILLTGGVSLFLSRTYAGKAIRAAAQDREVAMLMGITPEKIFTLTMGFGAAMAGTAGAVMMPYFYVFPTVGVSFGLMSFVVAIIGGLGNLQGSFLCGLLVGVAEAMGTQYITADAGLILAFVLLIITLVFRPQGIFSKSQRRG
jgi:branched-chain amino acid transport system permease protein